MSNHLYLSCVSHDPPIRSDELSRSYDGFPKIRKTVLRDREMIVNEASRLIRTGAIYEEATYETYNSYERNMLWFLYAHPNCNYELSDEYGRRYTFSEGPEEMPVTAGMPIGEIEEIWVDRDGLKMKAYKLTPAGHRIMNRIIQNEIDNVSLWKGGGR